MWDNDSVRELKERKANKEGRDVHNVDLDTYTGKGLGDNK